MLIILLRRIERTYYDRLLIDNRNMKKTWAIIKDVINTKKKRSSTSKFVINRDTVTHNIINAKHFKKYANIFLFKYQRLRQD